MFILYFVISAGWGLFSSMIKMASTAGSLQARQQQLEHVNNEQKRLQQKDSVIEGQDEETQVHFPVRCNQCRRKPIYGVRWKCRTCVDYDLCSTCRAAKRADGQHLPTHLMMSMPANPAHRRAALTPEMQVAVVEQKEEARLRKLEEFQKMEEENRAQMVKLEQDVMTQGLATMWNYGKLLLEKRVRNVCERILAAGEAKTNKSLKQNRAAALICLGEIFDAQITRHRQTANLHGDSDTGPFANLSGNNARAPPNPAPNNPPNSNANSSKGNNESKRNASSNSASTSTTPPNMCQSQGVNASGVNPELFTLGSRVVGSSPTLVLCLFPTISLSISPFLSLFIYLI
jgi:hypothetical protein